MNGNAKERKGIPLATGVLDYFPDALVAVAQVSKVGNDQHNPGEPLHWAREKSMDQADCIMRHLLDRGRFDVDGQRHSAKVAWRALALLQLEIEADAKKGAAVVSEPTGEPVTAAPSISPGRVAVPTSYATGDVPAGGR